MIIRFKEILQYYLAGRNYTECLGFFGHENLGDEAILVAERILFGQKATVPYVRRTRLPQVNYLLDRVKRKVILIGGGTLIHGGRAGSNGWLESVEHKIARGAVPIVFGTGVAFKDSQIASKSEVVKRWIAVLQSSPFVGVRGPISQQVLGKLDVHSEVVGDLAMSLSLISPKQERKEHNAIGINLGLCQGNQKKYETDMSRIILSLKDRFDIEFNIVWPHDLCAAHRILTTTNMKNFEIKKFYNDPYTFMEAMSAKKFIIGLKLHAVALTMAAGVPAILIGYQPKCRDFLESLNRGDLLVHLNNIENEIPLRIEHIKKNEKKLWTK